MLINDMILSSAIGTLIALVLAIPAMVGELRRKHKQHILLPDVHHGWGRRKLKDREVFAVGILIHLLAGLAFGAIYPLTVLWDPYPSLIAYSWGSLIAYGTIGYLVLNLILFPLGHIGFFGRKEDEWIWLETAVSILLLVVGYVLIVQWFQPSWFAILV
jgi:hypothetical protein